VAVPRLYGGLFVTGGADQIGLLASQHTMLILGIDTSGKSGGITLAEGDERAFRLIASSPIAGGTFSAQLVPGLASLLEKHGFAAADLDGFAVASGPGSFTGLRVGLSAVKGLAEVLGKPISTVSLLEALAIASGKAGRIAAAMDAGRSEVFFGVFHVSSGQVSSGEVSAGAASRIQERLLSQSEFVAYLRDTELAGTVSCDKALAALASAAGVQSAISVVERPGTEAIARIGLRKLLAGDTVSVEELDANYIRRSDAEIFAKAKP
jgi:tRNA threonylcarbamoyladenosine biosynthesis protein TsaB